MGLPLSQQKISEEIELLRAQRRREEAALSVEHRARRRRGLKEWAAILLALATALTATLTVGKQYLELLEARTRSVQVTLDQKLIDLTRELLDPLTSVKRRSATALLLSSFGRQAVPILLLELRSAEDPEPIFESLALIREHEESAAAWWRPAPGPDGEELEELLLDEAAEVVELERWAAGGIDVAFRNYVALLPHLDARRRPAARGLLVGVLVELRGRGEAETPAAEDRYAAREMVCDALRKLGAPQEGECEDLEPTEAAVSDRPDEEVGT